MKRFQSLIVVVSGKDGGQAAVDQAATLAMESSARIALVDAIDPLSRFREFAGMEFAQLHSDAETKKVGHMERLATPLRNRGLSVSCQLLQGDLAEKTIECVIRNRHDLLLKSAEQPEGIAQRLFGTTGHRLMRKCPCPVWIIKGEPGPGLKRILVAVSPFPIQKGPHPMNVTMLELSTSLASDNQCELDVVYVWPQLNDATKQEQRETDSLQEVELERLIRPYRHRLIALNTHLMHGDPSETIVNLTQKMDVDLLVLGTVCRSNFVLFTIGNTAERVLNDVQCSVLAVKPEAFLENVLKGSVERSLLTKGLLNPTVVTT